jgi:hypothetical protein
VSVACAHDNSGRVDHDALVVSYPGASLLNVISIPVGAQYTTAVGIKDYVISRCAGGS